MIFDEGVLSEDLVGCVGIFGARYNLRSRDYGGTSQSAMRFGSTPPANLKQSRSRGQLSLLLFGESQKYEESPS